MTPAQLLAYYRSNPEAELGFDDVESLGLDGTGRAADERFPYTWAKLTEQEQARLAALLTDGAAA